MEEIFELYKRNFPYISREEKTIKDIINNEDNIFIKKVIIISLLLVQ